MTEQSYYRGLPGKRMGAGAVFFDETGRLLIVKPVYRDGWLIPGGSIELDESPAAACTREVREELGIDAPVGRLLCVDYTSRDGYKSEAVQFLFHGGVLTGEHIRALSLPAGELSEFRLVPPAQSIALLVPKLGKRLPHILDALREGTTCYLENGQPTS